MRIVFDQGPAPRDVMFLTLDGSRRVEPLLQTPLDERNGVISPDARWLAYESNDGSGRFEIYVRPFPNVSGGQWQVSTAGGTQPFWIRTSRELFYLAPDGAVMAVRVETRGTTWSASTPTKIFEGRYFTFGASSSRMYDVSADGARFLMIKQVATDPGAAPPQIIVIQNWTEELKRLVPKN
jgi:eukaryotic-like serine/threonine-protein kinase